MNDAVNKALLPAGLGDLLPPEAEQEAALSAGLLAVFARYGYRRVKPPLVEFEEGLLDGVGAGMSDQTFRVMDPVSRRMMGLRADITPQVARIADTRLKGAPRPLRVSYGGEVLRTTGSQLSPERQISQTGVELIGAAKAAAGDAEVIVLAAEALTEAGVGGLSIDLHVPPMAGAVCRAFGVSDDNYRALRTALDRKDAAAIADIGGDAADLLGALLDTVGPAARGIEVLSRIALPEEAAALRDRLTEVVELVREAAPELTLTVDPVEQRGFEYHTGISFTVFAAGARGELGSGGRYLTGAGEPATGFTVYMDSLMRVAPALPPSLTLFVPIEVPASTSRALRAEGWVTVHGLIAATDDRVEAKRLGCTHFYSAGTAQPVGG
ncbi:MAG: ATP phosphoribosyltransferase regulatory subunit [Rhodospirillaceae bacterium]|nr:ATP phosphoribosyltransferase regulatory subunit [Rhodospirillaceae bacterium]